MDIIKIVHSTIVPLLDTTPLMVPTSVDCPSPTKIEVSVSTSGAMLQGIVSLVLNHVTAHVQLEQVEQPHHLLTLTFTVSLAVTQHQPTAGTPPTHFGMAKAATVVASAAAPVVHRGSSRPCLQRLRLTLKFAGVSRMELLLTNLALNNLKFMCTDSITALYNNSAIATLRI